jgi:hypothetical protein
MSSTILPMSHREFIVAVAVSGVVVARFLTHLPRRCIRANFVKVNRSAILDARPSGGAVTLLGRLTPISSVSRVSAPPRYPTTTKHCKISEANASDYSGEINLMHTQKFFIRFLLFSRVTRTNPGAKGRCFSSAYCRITTYLSVPIRPSKHSIFQSLPRYAG